ncbi:MAG: DNA alkylation repair protein [Bacteroidales bacterium]|nr:DNA alkylation repair protein [Bacteroidales bacterium]
MPTSNEIEQAMLSMADNAQRQILQRFFKTGEGQYGEGDKFLGIKVPQTRAVVRMARHTLPDAEIEKLLLSPWHEVRLCGFLLIVEEMAAARPHRKEPPSAHAQRRRQILDLYLRNARRANNWDLVDLSCPYVVGEFLLSPDEQGQMPSTGILDRLAKSDNLWEQRIAIVSTLALIRNGRADDSFRIADALLAHPHDLIHKAVGWALREVGKRDIEALRRYLDTRFDRLPRTSLRYAIERMPPDERRAWMSRK